MEREYAWDHISLTGAEAGLTACGLRLRDVHARNESTAYIPYSFTDRDIKRAYHCAACKAAWWGEEGL
jgi:hypothetical protein